MKPDPTDPTDGPEALMALGAFNTLCASAALVAEDQGLTQIRLLYCLWCFLSAHLLKEGVASQEMCDSVLFTERYLHGQVNPS